jgi:chromosome segregation ATPase
MRGVECPICRADHGISPAQLREKVASLDDESEVQAQRLNALEDANHKLREKVEALDLVLREAYRAIDALNTRVYALEAQQERWRGITHYTTVPAKPERSE